MPRKRAYSNGADVRGQHDDTVLVTASHWPCACNAGSFRRVNFLPVVERELRVRSRRTAFYWERLALAGVMLVVMLWFLATMAPFSRGAGMGMLGYGRHIFLAMSWVAFVVVVVGGVMETADCVSREKRDGTLGLLFLTDLRGLDVGLGKLTARSLTAFFGLLGAIPMLALPVMMGGVTGAEVVRVALVLVVAQMFSLTAGLLASTLCRSAAQAVGLAMSLVMVLNIIVPMVAASSEDRLKALFVACPGFALYRASEGGGPEYWTTVGIAAAMAGLFFAVACLLLPSSWQDRPGRQGKGTWSARMTQWTYGTGEARAGRRRSLLEINPILWLSSRERMRDLSPWFGLALVAGMILLVTSLIADDWREALRNFLNPFAVCFYAFCFHLLLKVKVCSDAARRFAEDRESGAIELLVATPMKTSEILSSCWRRTGCFSLCH
jgi:ABC-type transport system involved in multi-copper enzyme maturation permease subunit